MSDCSGGYSSERLVRLRRDVCVAIFRARHAIRGGTPVTGAGRAGSSARARRALHQWDAAVARARNTVAVLGLLRYGALDRALRFCRHGGARKVPTARRGHRAMSELSAWVAVPAAILLIAGGLLGAIGALGLLRLPDFFMRMHPPAMGSTLGA